MKSFISSENDIDPIEIERLLIMNKYEEDARAKGFKYIAGIDEAGRGPLAGPVLAAACIIPQGVYLPKVNDSKLITPKVRQELFEYITQDKRIFYGIGLVEVDVIDCINIYQATIKAMLMAIAELKKQPDYLLVDGLNLSHSHIPSLKIIKGDQLSQSIAAASILAKVTRDRLMVEYHKKWSAYGFDQHKGYATEQHLHALKQHGPCELHRKTFEPIKTALLAASAINQTS